MRTLLRWAESRRLAPLMACGLSLLLFANTVPHGHNLDDNLVTKGHRLTSKGFAALGDIITAPYYEDEMGYSYEYRPVTLASFAIEHQLFGEKAPVSHLINVLLFALTALLVTRAAFLLAPNGMVLLPALTGLLFAIHPMHVEAVASIKNRDELLSLLFAMGALIGSLRFALEGKWHLLLMAGLLMSLSLLSKTSSLALLALVPVAVALKDTWHRRTLTVVAVMLVAMTVFMLAAGWPALRLVYGAAAVIGSAIAAMAVRDLRWLHRIRELATDAGLPRPGQELETDPVTLLRTGWPFQLALFATLLIPVLSGNVLLLLLPMGIVVIQTLILRAFRIDSLLLFVMAVGVHGLTERIDAVFYLSFVLLLAVRCHSQGPGRHFTILVAPLMLMHSVSGALHPVESAVGDGILVLVPYMPWFVGILTARKFPKVAQWPFPLSIVLQSVSLCFDPTYENILILSVLFLSWHFFRKNLTGVTRGIVRLSFVLLLLSMALYQFRPSEPHALLRPESVESVSQPGPSDEFVENPDSPAAIPERQARPLTGIEFPLGQDATLDMRLGTASAVMGHYLRMMFVPWPQAFYYGFDEVPVVGSTDLRAILSALVHIILLLLAMLSVRSHPILSFGVMAYLSSVLLFSNLPNPVAGMIGDRLVHVASFGFCLALAYAVTLAFNRLTMPTMKRVMTWTLIIVTVSWGGMTVARNSHWKDEVTLMRRDIAHVPNSANANYLLGVNLLAESFRQKSPAKAAPLQKEAIHHMKRAATIFPGYINFWYDLGRAYRDIGDLRSALPCFKEAHRLDSAFYDATLHVAMIAEEFGNEATAIEYYERCIRFNPDELQAYTNLSFLYFRKGAFTESIAVNERAIGHNPDWRDPYENIARAHNALNDPKMVRFYMEKLQKLR